MSALTIALAAVVGMPLVLLSLPLSFQGRGRLTPDERRFTARITWAGGLTSIRVQNPGGERPVVLRLVGLPLPARRPGGKERLRKKKDDQKSKAKRGRFSSAAIRALLDRRLLTSGFNYLRRLVRALHLRLNLAGVYDTGDPALTGALAGLIAALCGGERGLRLDLRPEFNEPHLNISGGVSGRVIPLQVLWLTARLALSGPVRRLWWPKVWHKHPKMKEVIHHV